VTNTSIRPGQVWLDTNGNRIQSHGGSIICVDDTFYWYGENKEKTKTGSGIWHWGVRCYASKDLYNWEDCGLIIPPELDDPASPLHPSQALDRPHIIYNRETKQYVCWLKIMGGHAQTSTALLADSLLGPYQIVKTGLKPLGMYAGDFDLVVEPSDAKAYYYFERVHNELICADLSAVEKVHLAVDHVPQRRDDRAVGARHAGVQGLLVEPPAELQDLCGRPSIVPDGIM
jgi:hypothetical protein